MKTSILSFYCFTLSLLLVSLVQAQTAKQPDTIAVSEVKVIPALADSVRLAGKTNQLNRVIQSMDGQLTDAIQATRKFTVVARSDMDAIFREQDFAESGNVDLNSSGAAKRFQVAGVKYLVVPRVDDFQDYTETARFESLGQTMTRRIIRLSVVASIYDTTSGKLLESANLQLSNEDLSEELASVSSQGNLNDQLLLAIAQKMSRQIAGRVEDVIYPARVLARTGNQVTFSRGDGSSVARDQIWEVYARGEELIDPDTGVSLGVNEIPVGKIKVNAVRPQFSTGVVLEDFGIETGAILRPAGK